LAYLLALLAGIILGVLGGGGSILTVPIFVYVMGVNPITATAYSLFIVGVSALVGAQRFISRGDIDFKIGLLFALPSVLGVFVCRKWILPSLPEVINIFNLLSINKDTFILLSFDLIMFLASLSMLFSWKINANSNKDNNYLMVVVDGAIVGLVTGFVGAGGGFLIVPALLLMTTIDIKKAVGTSLLIIALKSLVGFLPEINNSIDWNLLIVFTSFSVLGILIGTYISKFIKGSNLKKSFGIFVLLMALFIVIKEMFF
jgi:uncharacterized protein